MNTILQDLSPVPLQEDKPSNRGCAPQKHPKNAHALKNRISRKIKNVAEVSKVQLKIQNNSRRLKTSAENLNLQPNVGRSAGKFETAAED